MREQSPHRTASDMARELGLTRERVRQILVELGLQTVVKYEPPKPPAKPATKKRAVKKRRGKR